MNRFLFLNRKYLTDDDNSAKDSLRKDQKKVKTCLSFLKTKRVKTKKKDRLILLKLVPQSNPFYLKKTLIYYSYFIEDLSFFLAVEL